MATQITDTAALSPLEKSDYFLQTATEIRDRPSIQSLLQQAVAQMRPSNGAADATRTVGQRSTFRPNQVETLLNQSQDLLHRMQSEMDTYNDLRARAVDVLAETAAELAELELIEARISSKNHRLLAHAERGENDALKHYLNTLAEGDSESSWESLKNRMCLAQTASEVDSPGMHSWIIERYKTILDLRLKKETTEAVNSRVLLADLDATRFEDTAAYLRKTADLKSAAMLRGGPWDFKGRFESMEAQIVGDWIDVQARLEASNAGLKTFFGYGKSERERDVPPSEQRSVGAMLTWVRAAVAWLLAFSQRDIAVTELISLRKVAWEKWAPALAELRAKQSCTLEFRWNGGRFASYDFVRLIGISIIAEGFPARLQAQLELPGDAFTLQHGDPDDIAAEKQSLPPYFFGRIDDASFRPPEVIGTVSLRNLSPISELPWKLTLFSATPLADDKWTTTCDIVVELGANVTPR